MRGERDEKVKDRGKPPHHALSPQNERFHQRGAVCGLRMIEVSGVSGVSGAVPIAVVMTALRAGEQLSDWRLC